MTNTALSVALESGLKNSNVAKLKATNNWLSMQITQKQLFSQVELKPVSKLVLFSIVNRWNSQNKCAYPSIDTLIDDIGMSKRAVNDAIKELKETDLIHVEKYTNWKNNNNNIYFLTNKLCDLLSQETIKVGANSSELSAEFSEVSAEIAPALNIYEQRKEQKKNNVFSFQKNIDEKQPDRIYYEPLALGDDGLGLLTPFRNKWGRSYPRLCVQLGYFQTAWRSTVR